MWQAEPPVQSTLSQPAIYLAAKPGVQQVRQKERVLGVCQPVEINTGDGDPVGLFPTTGAAHYMYKYEGKDNVFGDGSHAKVSLVQAPKFGQIEYFDEVPVKYLPNEGFEGRDSFVLQVEQGDVKVKIKYFVLVDYAANLRHITCVESPKGAAGWWKISLPTLPTSTSDIQSLLTQTGLSTLPTLAIGNLDGSTLAQTTGQGQSATITLDDNAANHGWYVDATPQDNAEYLPTSNPNLWLAKEGTEAAGKMDLLSVLLHEYGHALGIEHSALGIEHSADGNDYMAATLAPGVRRLPGSDELALMAQLASQAKLALDGSGSPDDPNPALPLSALGFALFGRIRRTDYGAWTIEAQNAFLSSTAQHALNPSFVPLPTCAERSRSNGETARVFPVVVFRSSETTHAKRRLFWLRPLTPTLSPEGRGGNGERRLF